MSRQGKKRRSSQRSRVDDDDDEDWVESDQDENKSGSDDDDEEWMADTEKEGIDELCKNRIYRQNGKEGDDRNVADVDDGNDKSSGWTSPKTGFEGNACLGMRQSGGGEKNDPTQPQCVENVVLPDVPEGAVTKTRAKAKKKTTTTTTTTTKQKTKAARKMSKTSRKSAKPTAVSKSKSKTPRKTAKGSARKGHCRTLPCESCIGCIRSDPCDECFNCQVGHQCMLQMCINPRFILARELAKMKKEAGKQTKKTSKRPKSGDTSSAAVEGSCKARSPAAVHEWEDVNSITTWEDREDPMSDLDDDFDKHSARTEPERFAQPIMEVDYLPVTNGKKQSAADLAWQLQKQGRATRARRIPTPNRNLYNDNNDSSNNNDEGSIESEEEEEEELDCWC